MYKLYNFLIPRRFLEPRLKKLTFIPRKKLYSNYKLLEIFN